MKDHLLSNLISKAGRRNLKDICREFDRCSRIYPTLYHQRMVPWSEKGRVGISLSQWKVFQCAESPQLDEEIWFQWDEPSCDDDYLGQWYNDGEGLAEFEDLSDSVAMVISQEGLDFDQYGINLEIRQGSDWLPLLHDWAFKYQMPLLRCDMSLWGDEDCDLDEFFELAEQWETLEDGTSIPRHPVVWRLIDNVFTSSMTALRAILWSDTVVTTNEPWQGIRSEVSVPVSAKASDSVEPNDDPLPLDIPQHKLIKEDLFWSVRCAETGQIFRFKSIIGFKYLAMLLQTPERKYNPIEAYEMHGEKARRTGTTTNKFCAEHQREATLFLNVKDSLDIDQPVIDIEADQEARKKFNRLKDLWEKAQFEGSDEQVLLEEINHFKKHYIEDHDKAGTIRLFPKSHWEKSRKAVTNAIDRTIEEIRRSSEELAMQLDKQLERKHGFCFRPISQFPKWIVIDHCSQS